MTVMQKARLRFFLIAASMTATGILAAFFAVSWLAPAMATKQLAAYGISVQGIAIKRFGLRESEIGSIQLLAEDKGIQARLENVRIGYRLTQLWDGRLDYIRIEHADLSIHPAAPSTSASPTALPTPAEILNKIPLDHFNIQRIDIGLFTTDNTAARKLEGKMELNDRKFHFELNEAQATKPLSASATLDGSGTIDIDIHRGRDQLLALKSVLHRTEDQYLSQGSMNADLEKLSTEAATWLGSRIPKVAGKLKAQWLGHLPGNMALNTETLRTGLKGKASVTLDATAFPGSGTSVAARMAFHADYENGAGRWSLKDKSYLSFQSGNGRGKVELDKVAGSFHLQPGQVRLEVAQDATLKTDKLVFAGGEISAAAVRLLQPFELGLTPGAPWHQTHASALLVTAGISAMPSFGLAGMQTTVHLVQLRADSLDGSVDARFTRPTADAVRLPDCRLASNFKLAQGKLSAKGSLDVGGDKLHMTWFAFHHLPTANGHADISLQRTRLGRPGLDVGAILAKKELPEISGGEISGSGAIGWERPHKTGGLQFRHDEDVELKSLAGKYDSYSFTGLDGHFLATGSGKDISLSWDKLAVDAVNVGLPIRKLSVQGRIHLPGDGGLEVHLENLGSDVLGGTISSKQIDIDLARAHNPFVIELRNIDAVQLVKLQNQEGLYADGILDGYLAADWAEDGLYISDGMLKARPPGGLIRYLGNDTVRGMASSNQAVRMALNILSDFHYQQMQIGINAQADGNTKLGIHLKGQNPSYENGRPIEFNLNVEQNILKLLQSLSMSNRISERLEKKIQKQMGE
jgi:hypothetical protein